MFADAKYEVTATASGAGRDGKTTLADGTMFLDLVIAKELERLWQWRTSREAFQLSNSDCFLRSASSRTNIKRIGGLDSGCD